MDTYWETFTNDPIATGTVGSIIGGFVLLFVQWAWRRGWFSRATWFQTSEPRIVGKWKTQFEEKGQIYSENVTLRQRGRTVTADIVLREGEGETVYKFDGTFKNLILSGTYQSVDQADYERGAILLRYTTKGKFVGQNIFFSKTSESLVPSPYEWTRVL